MAAVFWVATGALFFSVAGYPLLMRALAALFPKPRRVAPPSPLPKVSAVIAAHNEEARIVARIENLQASDYPRELLEILVVSDGSTDATARVAAACGPGVRMIELPERMGKAACLNRGVAAATGDLLLFCDARQSFGRDALAALAENFSDPSVGAASGALLVGADGAASSEGVRAYWEMEKRLREDESRFDSSVGCTGAIYAIRRTLYRELPPDTLLDDVVIPMRVAEQGFRVVFDRRAVARDPQPFSAEAERRRKRRTMAGNFQMLFRYPGWVFPGGHRLWWQLVGHKFLRLGFPAFVAAILLSAWALRGQPFYAATFALGAGGIAAGCLGLLSPGFARKVLAPFSGFLLLNAAILDGLLLYLRSPRSGAWETAQSPPGEGGGPE